MALIPLLHFDPQNFSMINEFLTMGSCFRWSGYTLFMDDPVNPGVKVPINHSSKLCDVIAKWEGNVKPNNNQVICCDRSVTF